MYPNPRKIIPIVLLIAGISAFIYWFFFLRAPALLPEEIIASGTIEIVQLQIAPELGGRVKTVAVEEGQVVMAGAELLRLDETLLLAQRTQAEAALAAAQANLAAAEASLTLLKAGPSPQQLAVSRSTLNQAQVAYDAARQVYEDLPEAYRDSSDGKAALTKADAAEAALETAQAQHELLAAGARAQQIEAADHQVEAAQAQVESARAALGVVDVQINKLTLVAPVDGVVMTLFIHSGEFVAPGSTLLILGQEASKTITVYIPEEVYGQVSLGQKAEVRVDSFPGETFEASVIVISDQAEFTPRNVQTTEGRKNTVFAIKLRLADPGDQLKAGMPADVVFKK